MPRDENTLLSNWRTNANLNVLDGKDQIIVGRVKRIFLEGTDDDNLGAIEIQPVYPENQTTIVAYPFFPNTTSYPLLEEIVLCNKLPSEFLGVSEASEKYYYMGVVNVWNNPHVNFYPSPRTTSGNIPTTERKSYQDVAAGSTINIDPTLSDNYPATQGTFEERNNVHPLQPYLGDTIYQGRFGNSIRLGSTAKPTNTSWSSVGKNGDPITVLRNGQSNLPSDPWKPIIENINDDPSSIYLTSTQRLPINIPNPTYFSYQQPPTLPSQYSGAQVIINSDRLVFNAKKDHALISGEKSVNLSSNGSLNFDTKNFIVEADEIKLGSLATEPLVKGETLRQELDFLLKSLIQMVEVLKYTQSWPGGGAVVDAPTSTTADGVEKALTDIKNNLDSILSTKSKTV